MPKRVLTRVVIGFTACLCAAVFFTACDRQPPAGAGNASPSSQTLTIWWAQWAPADGLAQLGELFQKETGVAVKVHQIPWSSFQDQVFLNFGNARTDFDIVVGDSQWIGRGATRGLYLELTDWLKQQVDLASLHPRAMRYLCEYPPGSGRYFAAPAETDAIGFAYRRDWFENDVHRTNFAARFGYPLAPPQTWQQFRDIAEFFHDPAGKRYGCALLTGADYDSRTMGFQPFLWAWGGDWHAPGGFKVVGHLNTPGAAQGLAFMKDLLRFAPMGASNFDYSKTLESFNNGSTAMAMNYFAFSPDIVRKMGPKAGFFPVPGHDGKRFVSLGGQGMSISAKTPPAQQELARRFIAWFLQKRVQDIWVTREAGFTANLDILRGQDFAKAQPYNAAFAASLDDMQDFWNVPVYNDLLAAAQRHVGEALEGQVPPQQALDALAREHEQTLRDAGLLE